jgi:hypothetical protein
MKLQPEDLFLLSCVKVEPTSTELKRINDLIPLIQDWDYLAKNSIDRGIAPLLFKKLPLLSASSVIPATVKVKLQQAYYKTCSRSMILYTHFCKIAEACSSQGIPVIALKGIYLSEWLYQDIGLRQFSDIDLLVKEEDGEKCLAVLAGLGYSPYGVNVSEFVKAQLEIIHFLPMVLDGVSVEIHIKLHRSAETYHVKVAALWENAVPATINGVQVYVLNLNDLLIHLCLHLDKHFKKRKIQFTCFNDITNLLDKQASMIDWPVFTELCRSYNCEDIVFKYIVLVNRFMYARVPDFIIQKYACLLTKKEEWLFCKCLRGNAGVAITLSSHFGTVKRLQGFLNRVRYIGDVLFPPKIFMVQKYKIKRPSLVLFYYPYRYFIGIMGVMSSVKKFFDIHLH